MIEGFTGTDSVKGILEDLLDITIDGIDEQRIIVQAPAKTSQNTTITDGVVHCLTYGFHPLQVEENNHGERGRYLNREGRIRHRVILPKSLGCRSRSRSRSPSPDNIDLVDNVTNIRTRQPPGHMREVLQNPHEYELNSNRLHYYFEPHKPDFLIYKKNRNTPKAVATVLLEVSSYKKYGKGSTFYTHLKLSTEQLVQQCLAGISDDQPKISGLLFVPDGMKFVDVQVQNDQNHTYLVRESGLVQWNQTDEIYALLFHLENEIRMEDEI